VLGGLLPDGLILNAAGPARRCRGAGTDTPVRTGAADPGGDRQIRVERLAELAGVLLGQVDAVIHAVEPELDRAVGVPAADVIARRRVRRGTRSTPDWPAAPPST
jgi:hypothetical protein